MLLERRRSKKQLHAVGGAAGAAPRYIQRLSLALLRARPIVVRGLFRSGWKRRPKNKVFLPVPSPGADVDTGGSESECGEEEEEEEFFEDLRRVRRGELISKARVHVPTRSHAGSSAAAAAAAASSISRVLGLLAKKGGVFSATLVRKAARTTRVHAGKNMAGEEETGGVEGVQEGGRGRGGGLCEMRVLVGRRSKRHYDGEELG